MNISSLVRLGVAVAIAATFASLGACSSSQSRSGYDDGTGQNTLPTDPGSLGGTPAGENPKAEECQKMDLVFVVDNSGSMAEEQANLAANFPKFVTAIEDYKTKSGSKLDYRLAVTTTGRDLTYSVELPGFGSIPQTEKGDNGAFRMKKECGTTKRWIERSDANVTSAFSCLAKAGTDGPSMEMPLYALKLALNDRMADGTNAGFLRSDALLAIVFLTDEDDCSREDNNFTLGTEECDANPNVKPVTAYKSMLDNVAGGEGRWATAVIAGDKTCTSSFGDAVAAPRLKKFVASAGKNGTFSSICEGDLTSSLKQALATFDAACKTFPPVR